MALEDGALLREGRFASLPTLLQLSATAQAIAPATEEHREALARALARTTRSCGDAVGIDASAPRCKLG